MAGERRPHPSRTGSTGTRSGRAAQSSTRPLRQPQAAQRPRSATGGTQHVRGERVLRDGTRVRPAAKPLHAVPTPRARTLTRIPLASSHRRLHAVLIVVAMGLSLCGGRLLQLQGFDPQAYAATSADLLTRTLPLLPARGEITDRNGLVLASTQPAVAVTADPTLTTEKAPQIAALLSPYLQMSTDELMPLLTRPNTRFVYLKHQVPALAYSQLSSDLAKQKIYGIFRESDPIRTYPNGTVAAPLVGFVNADGKGREGLERSFNKELAGTEGTETYESAPNGSKIPLGQSSLTPAVNGLNLQTTIDSELQYVAEKRLAAQVSRQHAASGVAITMNVKTGELLAMASVPSFNASDVRQQDAANLQNRAVSTPYEPGSVQKVLTSAALIDGGFVDPETPVKVPPLLKSGDLTIKDHFVHPEIHLNMRGVIANSSNIGTALLARQGTKQSLHDYLASFGLGAKTGIEVPGESQGILPSGSMTDITRDQIAFGQALSVTAVQEAAAIAGIVNDGVYNPPTVVKQATDGNGNAVSLGDTRTPRRIVSSTTSAEVRDLMEAVVDLRAGTSPLKLPAYRTGGKTGTAQLANTKCHCYRGYVTSYVGVAPISDPQILTYVVVTDPKKDASGSAVAAPVYRDIMNFALPRYGVMPDTSKPSVPVTTW
ncbi:MAG: ftsI [Friedmanniella sp.]|nr:ftsI [Friedmanniella sp.]